MNPRPHSRADDVLEEWTQTSALGRRRAPADVRSSRRPGLGVASALAAIAVVAVVVISVLAARPLGVAGPSASSSNLAGGPLRTATWRLDPLAELEPDSTSVPVLLTERECASGQSPAGRIAEPVIEYTDAAVVILLQVRMVGGDCQANTEHALTVELDEPLNNRTLVDAGFEPPVARWTPGPDAAPAGRTCDFTAAEDDPGPSVYVLQDATGLIEKCEVGIPVEPSSFEWPADPYVFNPDGDRRLLELWWIEGACGNRTVIFEEPVPGRFDLSIREEPLEGECAAVGFLYGALFTLRDEVRADRVTATVGASQPPGATTPDEAVRRALNAVALGDLAAASRHVCAEQRDPTRMPFTINGWLEPVQALPGSGDERVLDTVELDVSDLHASEASRIGATAEVAITGVLVEHFDAAKVEALFRAMAAESGQPLEEDLLRQTLVNVSAGPVTVPVDQTERVVLEEGGWKVCPIEPTEADHPISHVQLVTDPEIAPADLSIRYLGEDGGFAYYEDHVPAGQRTLIGRTDFASVQRIELNGQLCAGEYELRRDLVALVLIHLADEGTCSLTTTGYAPYQHPPHVTGPGPLDDARARLRSVTGEKCFDETDDWSYIDDTTLDAYVAGAGGHGWAVLDEVWVGELDEALYAFGAWEVVLRDEDRSALLLRWVGDRPEAIALATEARGGRPAITRKVHELQLCGATSAGLERPPDAPAPDGLRTDLDDCASLDVARIGDDSGLSYEFKVASFAYFTSDGTEEYRSVRFTDPACEDHAVIGPLIEHLIETHFDNAGAPPPVVAPDDID